MAYSDVVLADSPLVYARLSGVSSAVAQLDSSGNNRHSDIIVGTPTYNQTGLITEGGQAVQFGGAGSGLQWTYNAAWMNPASITVEAWINGTVIGGTTQPQILERDKATARSWQFGLDGTNGQLAFVFWTNLGGYFVCRSTTTLLSNTTYHVAATYNAVTGIANVYVNGVAEGAKVVTPSPLKDGTAPLSLACGYVGGSTGLYSQGFFTGRVDEAAVYGTALPTDRIRAHYNAGGPVSSQPRDVWVWNGTTEVPADVSIWKGNGSEVPATVEVYGSVPGLPTVTGLQAWYDADDATTFSYSSGVVVSQWRDKSGANRHLAQATVANQPARSQTRPNGRLVVSLDGTNDYLDTAAFTLAQPMTIFLAMSTVDRAQGFFSSVSGSLQIYNVQAPYVLGAYAGATLNAAATDGAHIWAVVFNGGTSKVYRDRGLVASGNTGTAGTTTGFRTAERNLVNYMQGQMFEILVYNSVLNATDQRKIEDYLRGKWGTP